jgi:pyridoxamine 5'-phosphate oxidase
MDFKDCIKFANETPICYLATVDGDQPRIRPLLFWFADDSGFYFQTGSYRDMYSQLQANKKVEVCFWLPSEAAEPLINVSPMMRVAGEVEFVDDPKLKKKILEDRTFLKKVGLTFDDPRLIIFRIAKGEAYFWTKETDLEPKKFIKFGE